MLIKVVFAVSDSEISRATIEKRLKGAYEKAHAKKLEEKANAKDKKSVQVPRVFDFDADIAVFFNDTTVELKNLKKLASFTSFFKSVSPKIRVNGLKFTEVQDKSVKLWVPKTLEVDVTSSGDRWKTLTHNGVYITEPYLTRGLVFGSTKISNPKDEELLGMYGKKLFQETNPTVRQYTTDITFIKNYTKGLSSLLSKPMLAIVKPFFPTVKSGKEGVGMWNSQFKSMVRVFEKEKANTTKTKGELTEKKKKELFLKETYGYAKVDGEEQEIGNFKVEPPGLFLGRGDHPNRGCIKPRITSRDITINISPKSKVPVPSDGGKWAEVVHDKSASWIAKWNDHCTDSVKYVFLSKSSKIQGENTLKKYEKARLLGSIIDEVVKKYERYTRSTSKRKQQIGVVVYMIDHFAFRVGGEKSESEADTVGATTLKVENITVVGSSLVFDFLGKDSVRYEAKHDVPENISKLVKEFQKGKKKSDLLFDAVTADDINKFLKSFETYLSAKVIRTYRSSVKYNEKLKLIPRSLEINEKIHREKIANREVAILCNHKKKKSATAEANVEKLKKEIRTLKKELRTLKKENSTQSKITATKKKIETREKRLEKGVAEMELSCTTSKMNYIDPRITVAWALRNGIDPKKLFTGVMLKSFAWAIEGTTKSWKYEK